MRGSEKFSLQMVYYYFALLNLITLATPSKDMKKLLHFGIR